MSPDNLVLTERRDGITIVTLNRPKALNALSSALKTRIADVFTELATDDRTQIVILTGSGRAFTVGLDLKEISGETSVGSTGNVEKIEQIMVDFPKPIIGAINGYAITGGFELALYCDFLIAVPGARFADTHARVGVVPGWGLTQRLPRLIGINRALELSLTGNYLNAQTAERWGLVNRIVSLEELLPHCEQLARDILSTEKDTRNEIRRIIKAGWNTTLAEGLEIEIKSHHLHGGVGIRPDVASRRADIQQRGRTQQGN